ncbi:MAG TPA: hypothetical protein VLB50_14065 [Ignavibacteriaceae bacterium]|nr:hypothetical protein [Ignavibacteriaceae bacterium]
MAILNNSIVLQNATGTIGNFYVRKFRGKKILVTRNPVHRKSKSAAAVKGRNNFSAVISLAVEANKVTEIKDIWKTANVEGSSPFQRMIKNNLKRVNNGVLTPSNIITPDGLPLTINSISVENNILKLGFNLPSIVNIHFPANLFILFFFNKYDRPVFSMNSKIDEPSADGTYNKNITISEPIKKAFKVDSNPIIYVAAAGSTLLKKKEYWTKTAAMQL